VRPGRLQDPRGVGRADDQDHVEHTLSRGELQPGQRLLKEVDRVLFRPSKGSGRPERVEERPPADKRSGADASRMPLRGRKLHVHTDWQGEMEQS